MKEQMKSVTIRGVPKKALVNLRKLAAGRDMSREEYLRKLLIEWSADKPVLS